MNRLAIKRSHINWLVREESAEHRARHIYNNGYPQMRDRQTVTDRRRHELLAADEQIVNQLLVSLWRQLENIQCGAQNLSKCVPRHVVVERVWRKKFRDRRQIGWLHFLHAKIQGMPSPQGPFKDGLAIEA